jgi:hypothetical protein
MLITGRLENQAVRTCMNEQSYTFHVYFSEDLDVAGDMSFYQDGKFIRYP